MIGSFPKITVVTPNFNQEMFLEQTILSVLNQNYPNLEYIIMDGGSTDGSLDIIKKYEHKLTYWESQKDKGMYDAINKGFSNSTGKIMCWINSDDVLWNGALHYIANLFSSNPKVQWLQGFPSVINEQGAVILQRPPVYSKLFFYFKKHEKDFVFIQQESTFWTRNLWERSGAKMNLNYSLAADFDLWMRFFKYETLYCTRQQLAAFRKRANQQSGNTHLYLEEVNNSLEENKLQLSVVDKAKLRIATLIYKYGFLRYRFLEKFTAAMIGDLKYING